MFKTLTALALLALSASAFARGNHHGASTPSPSSDRQVSGYVKKDGTYVAPYRQTQPNGDKQDNWSSKPNVNPYTGKRGTRTP